MDSQILPHKHASESRAALLKAQLDNKTADFQVLADVFKMLADSSRVRIFWLLCHCEECVADISALVSMSSPAVSHHLRQLKDSGLIVSRRVGKEVYYRAAQNELSELLHIMIEQTMEVSCPADKDAAATGLDSYQGHEADKYSAFQIETAHRVHEFLTQNLDTRCTIEELSRAFLMNPSTLKEIFKAVYGDSIAAHIKNHRIEYAAARLLDTDDSIAEIAKSVGYESHSKFSAEFRKMYGISPAAYRKEAKH